MLNGCVFDIMCILATYIYYSKIDRDSQTHNVHADFQFIYINMMSEKNNINQAMNYRKYKKNIKSFILAISRTFISSFITEDVSPSEPAYNTHSVCFQ